MPDIAQFLERLSSADPVPGGGSVAALDAALGASLLVMVVNLTIGRKRYADVDQQVRELGIAGAGLRDHAHQLIQIDSDAYEAVAQAMALPRTSEDEKSRRTAALQAALKRAVIPPRDTMNIAMRVARLAQELARIGNRSAISDVGTAALVARSAFQSALLNVEINLSSIRDDEWVAGIRTELGDAEEMERLTVDLVRRVQSVIEGNEA